MTLKEIDIEDKAIEVAKNKDRRKNTEAKSF